jgi:NADPH-dependent curcumin reductase CurA
MTAATTREIRLKSRPTGTPRAENFELASTPMPAPGEGQMLIRNIWMTVDPYMRGRMMDRESYIPPFQIGQVLDGGSVGEVIASKVGPFKPGDYVCGFASGGWREHYVSDGSGLQQVDPKLAPLQAYLGTLGMPGLTAYTSLLRIGAPKEGETVLVSAASGAVGAIVCQIAKIKGCRVVGTAGSDAKVAWLKDEIGIDAAINYKTCGNLEAAIARACPKGIDIYFENVGGAHLEAALNLMNRYGRLVMCGMIAQYNDTTPAPGPSNLMLVIGKSLKMQGFIVSDFLDMVPSFFEDMAKWIGSGKITWRETVLEGIENAPRAFLNLFSGENFGKMLVRLGPDRAS